MIFVEIIELAGSMNGEHKLVGHKTCVLLYRIPAQVETTNITKKEVQDSLSRKFLSLNIVLKGKLITITRHKAINDIETGDSRENIHDKAIYNTTKIARSPQKIFCNKPIMIDNIS